MAKSAKAETNETGRFIMVRPTLEQIFLEPDEFGLLDVHLKSTGQTLNASRELSVLNDVNSFFERHGRLPDADALDHEEMRLGTIWQVFSDKPTEEIRAADRLGILAAAEAPSRSWHNAPLESDIPADLDEIFSDELAVDLELLSHRHTTPAADRNVPDHRANFIPCRDFDNFRALFETVQAMLEAGQRKAFPVKKWAVIEPIEGDFFIRNGLLALIAEKSEMSARSGSRDYRLRVIFSNGTESDPLMSSFRKSLNDDQTARMLDRIEPGMKNQTDDGDLFEQTGTIYVARSLTEDPALISHKSILHKIGVTSQDVRRRVADARNDPTFLLAPVEIVATFDLKNLPRRKVEELLHRFFEAARPNNLFIVDRFGKKVRPKEWFYVLPEHVSAAAKLIREKTLYQYRYDPQTQKIIKK